MALDSGICRNGEFGKFVGIPQCPTYRTHSAEDDEHCLRLRHLLMFSVFIKKRLAAQAKA
jgi:hypothetical protein